VSWRTPRKGASKRIKKRLEAEKTATVAVPDLPGWSTVMARFHISVKPYRSDTRPNAKWVLSCSTSALTLQIEEWRPLRQKVAFQVSLSKSGAGASGNVPDFGLGFIELAANSWASPTVSFFKSVQFRDDAKKSHGFDVLAETELFLAWIDDDSACRLQISTTRVEPSRNTRR